MAKNKKSQKDLRKDVIKKFSAAVMEASQTYGKSPALITKAEYNEFTELSEWEIRKLGGYTNLLKVVFPFDDQDLASIRENQRMKNHVAKLERELGDKQSFEKNMLALVDKTLKEVVKGKPYKIPKRAKSKKTTNMTIELMVSDVHYGKKSDTFDLETCRNRMRLLSEVFLSEMEKKQNNFNVERVILALLGDILESYTMHGLESAISCEFGNSRQMTEAINSLFWDLIMPIAMTGVQIDIPCVPGNHDRSETNRTFNYPGENNLSYTVYTVLEMLCKAYSLTNVNLYITKDSYCVLDVYGNHVLYEHGDNVRNTQKGTILNHLADRSRQEKKQISMIRLGHWHEYVCYDRGRAIINESVCGQDSFAKVKGFDSKVGQTINFYVETENRPNSFYYSFPVDLGQV